MSIIVVTEEETIQKIVQKSVDIAITAFAKTLQPNQEVRKVSRREAAKIEGISISMLDKIRDRYVSEKVGPRKRMFLVRDGQLVRSKQ